MERYPRGDIYSGAYEKIADYSIFAFYESWRQEHAQMSLKYFATYIKSLYLKSGKDLLERLNAFDDRLLCSLVHKFGKRGSGSSETDYEKYIEDLKNALPKDFSAKGDIVVFVDECHRTQSGKLHEAMKAILPNAIFIGFTGTPLLKKDKKRPVLKPSADTSIPTSSMKVFEMALCWICGTRPEMCPRA